MMTLADDLVPDELGRWSNPCCGPATPTLRWPAPQYLRPGLLGRDRVHGSHLHSLAANTCPRAGLWLAGDMLAAPDRVGQRRRL